MRGTRTAILTILAIMAMLAPLAATAAEKGVIIGFHERPGLAEHTLLRGFGGKIKHQFTMIRAIAARMPEDTLDKLRTNPQVAYVEEDAMTALAETVSDSSAPDHSWGIARVGAPGLHALGNFGQGVRIAVLDTGIDATHPELAASYRGGINLVTPGLTEPLDDSWNGHGTHVAGILAAAADGSGVTGMAPAAELYAVKVVDGGGFGEISGLIAGLEWAIAHQIDIVNISLGSKVPSLALEQACQAADQAGILLVAAAGNTRNDGGAVLYPAAYAQVIAVSATARDDSAVWISAAGPQIELAAPGGEICSTAPGGGYATLTGTSQAAPHVAGAAALLLAAGTDDLDGNGITDCRDIRRRLQQTALDLGAAGVDATFGHGLVQVMAVPRISLRLTRQQGRIDESCRQIDLDAGRYEMQIANDSLCQIRIEATDRDGRRSDLSRSVGFRPRSPAMATVSFVVEPMLHLVLIPEGPIDGFADIVIRKN
jgi:subtilisin